MTTLREAAQQLLTAVEDSGHKSDVMKAAEALRAALAEQAQPVAWAPMWAVDRLTGKLGGKADPVTWGLHAPLYARLPRHDAVALYTTPPAPVAPPGWRMVPVEPTREMQVAAWGSPNDPVTIATWQRMLAAAPEAPEPVVPQPLTIERLRDALVASRIIDPGAVEDPDDYDDGVTLHRIEALFRRIA